MKVEEIVLTLAPLFEVGHSVVIKVLGKDVDAFRVQLQRVQRTTGRRYSTKYSIRDQSIRVTLKHIENINDNHSQ